MAFDALRSVVRRGTTRAPALADGSPVEIVPGTAEPGADGGIDAVAFGCPSCGRTIARGARRCDGCGQWLLLDVPLERAGALAGAGAVAGVLATILLVNLFAPASGVVPRGGARSPAAGGDGPGTAAGAGLGIPTGAAAALRGTTAINGRLAAEAEWLAAAVTAKSLKTGDVVKVLRRMSVDTRAGAGMVELLGAWPEAAAQQAALAGFYAQLDARIDAGLASSVKSGSAYRKTAKGVLATLRAIPGLDADARALAAGAGLELVPIALPAVLE